MIIQATPFCNIDCTYCYLPNRSDKSRITPQTVERIFQRISTSGLLGERITIVWHAGEPMMVPVDAYEEFFDIAKRELGRVGVGVTHSFQTNATMVDGAWCDFFARNDVKVGVSLDGPREIHDQHRRYRNGTGTFDRTLAGLRDLRSAGINPGVITVVTSALLPFAREYHDLMTEEGVQWVGLNVEEVEGSNLTSTLLHDEQTAAWKGFVRTLFSLSRKSGLRVREFSSFLQALSSKGSAYDDQTRAFSILSFGVNGDFSTFSPELLTSTHGDRHFIFGNVESDALAGAQSNANFLTVASEIAAGVKRCQKTCSYFEFCGGGAPANKLFENGKFESTETSYCRFRRKLMIDAILDELLDKARAGDPLPRDLAC